MISLLQTLPVGNAVRLFISPPVDARKWRVLRRAADNFTGPDDTGAFMVHEGDDHVVLDITALPNNTPVYYRGYWWDGMQWRDSLVTASATPMATLRDGCVDVLTLLRDRVGAGLEAEVAAGRLRHEKGRIRVYNAPPRQEDVVFPVVTVQLTQDAPAERLVGEMIAHDEQVDGGDWREYEGWYSRVQIELVGWSFNPDERIALRQALKRIVIGNLPVFDDAGMMLVEFSQQDNEDYQSFTAPVYQTWGTFSCLAPSAVAGDARRIADVTVDVHQMYDTDI